MQKTVAESKVIWSSDDGSRVLAVVKFSGDEKEYKVWKNEFPNLDAGSVVDGDGAMKQTKKGAELFFVKSGGAFGKGGKPGGGGNVAAFALSYSKDVAVAMIEGGAEAEASTEKILARASEFLKWLKAQ